MKICFVFLFIIFSQPIFSQTSEDLPDDYPQDVPIPPNSICVGSERPKPLSVVVGFLSTESTYFIYLYFYAKMLESGYTFFKELSSATEEFFTSYWEKDSLAVAITGKKSSEGNSIISILYDYGLKN